jgi:hypothetical protein
LNNPAAAAATPSSTAVADDELVAHLSAVQQEKNKTCH